MTTFLATLAFGFYYSLSSDDSCFFLLLATGFWSGDLATTAFLATGLTYSSLSSSDEVSFLTGFLATLANGDLAFCNGDLATFLGASSSEL